VNKKISEQKESVVQKIEIDNNSETTKKEDDDKKVTGICCTEGCGKPARLQCPTCIKLLLPPSPFCTQECFKSSWAKHKIVHVSKEKKVNMDPRFTGYMFTGKLRPGFVSPMRIVPSHIHKPDYATHPQGISISERSARGSAIVEIKSNEEIAKMRKVCRFGREVLEIAAKMVKVGTTTDEIDRVVHEACIERECYPSPLNYYNFPKSVCTSINEVVCHGIPDNRELEDGDIINIDISTYYDGVHGDLNETYLVGNVDEQGRKLVQTTSECLQKSIEIVKPGTMYREVGNVISKHAQSNGFSVVRSYCGHGIGKLFHSTPNVPHYAKNKAIGTMKPGHVFTIEPMINEGVYNDQLWPDDWTSVTKDGKRSAQFEHTLLVTETGCDVLTAVLN